MLYHHAYLLTFYGHGDVAYERLRGVFERVSVFLLQGIIGHCDNYPQMALTSSESSSSSSILTAVDKVWSEYASIVDTVKGVFMYFDVNYLPAKGKQPVMVLGYETFTNVLIYSCPSPFDKSLKAAMGVIERERRAAGGGGNVTATSIDFKNVEKLSKMLVRSSIPNNVDDDVSLVNDCIR